ncbi:hypothetical protein DNU06_13190 [Putridiphycobacter roseus]|uniref:Gliding motility protein GldM n=1 Tax=Putridiphycobacter roseus TaxID=2219161 RepID=A0A2W1NB31_9FLAO|nr:GldM family protein [Putridiphycobacter roseus]PZE16495.1 hypothetical protein DNU06_13190 [Putridiphycobacter roseus]
MAGGKETPRQKMIGMMYLVLTALLALNVSKEVIAAFVTINNKIGSSSQIIQLKSQDTYHGFQQKKAGIMASNGNLTAFNHWHEKALLLQQKTAVMVDYILGECSEMIELVEGKEWIKERDENGFITELNPLIDIQNMDNYDIPTHFFIGSNPQRPNERGLNLRDNIHAFRDSICTIMANYTYDKKTYSFTPPKTINELENALNTVRKEDRKEVEQVYKLLSIPETLKSNDAERVDMPWSSVMFDHAPVVAAASILSALKLDIENGEAQVADYLLRKIDGPIFKFNKIEPLAFAPSNYLNEGDSANIKIMVAAYDSTNIQKIRYGIDQDTIEANWKETAGAIRIKGTTGQHKIKGAVGILERGILKWRPWSYDYTVGQPMGVISQPDMRVLYKGYDNIVSGVASGYPTESISISGSGCSIRKTTNGKYIVSPNSGNRQATLSISARDKNGKSIQLGSFDYTIRPMPIANAFLGSIKSGDSPSHSAVTSQRKISLRFGPEVNLKPVTMTVISGTVSVEGINKKGKVNAGGMLNSDALQILRQSRGKTVTIMLKYKDSSQQTKRSQPIIFKSR